MMKRRNACVAGVLLALLATGGVRSAPPEASLSQQAVDQGIRVQFGAAQPAEPGGAVGFRFQLSDTASNTPLRGLRPAAWLSQRAPGAAVPNCKTQAANFLGGDLFKRADIDLNSFFVLTLNDDATVSVVDPMFSFGGSKLLNLLQLESRGADWSLVSGQSKLFVSMPEAGAVALIDTRQWRIIDIIRTGPRPRRMAVAGNRIWVADDQGVSSIDIATRAVTALPLAAATELTASSDGDWLFVAHGSNVAVIDAHAGRVARQVKLDGAPSLLAYSHAAQAVYAADTQQGKLYAIDAQPHAQRQVVTVDIQPGAAQLRFTPDGRYALLPVPGANLMQVLDAASNRLVHSVTIADGPEQISFSDRIAYVRRRDSEIVLMIQLEQLGNLSRALGIADFTGGQKAFGGTRGVLADSLAGAPEGGSVLLVNPDDRMVYLYKEGMAAPAGGFRTYAQTPRAVMVVDHGLREVGQGAYATTIPVKRAGLYDVVLFNDAPRVLTCFAANIGIDTGPADKRPLVKVSAVEPAQQLTAGHNARLRFALSDADGHPLAAAADVRALAMVPPGVWQRRLTTTALDNSSYEIEFTPPQAGVYYVWIESESLGLPRNNPQFKMFQVFSQESNHEQ